MASSQNEQDNRHYAVAAAVPMLEPSDSQEAYEFTHKAIEISERWKIPVMLRLTTRVCHAKTIVRVDPALATKPAEPIYEKKISRRVMIPANARPAHRRLRIKLAEIAKWNEESGPNRISPPHTIDALPLGRGGLGRASDSLETERLVEGSDSLPFTEGEKASVGIVCSGISYVHAREAAPDAAILKLGMTYPIPLNTIREFAKTVDRCVVIEEGDPWLADAIRAAGISVEDKPEMYRFNELNVERIRRILAGDTTPEQAPPPGKPPELCAGCPHRYVFQTLRDLNCIVSGDIGCYTLGALPPFEALEMMVCMGAAIGMGLGLRHVLPADQSARVVSVIGDSTFAHSGITGLVEMVYNPPPDGHVVIILDNGTTAMTGMQEHPGTGRALNHERTNKVIFEDLAKSLGIDRVHVVDPKLDGGTFAGLVKDCLDSRELAVIIARSSCLLAAGKIKLMEKQIEQQA
jgi:indolepyruvate ferredoxin oxidoreductase alpha subunit